MKNLKLMPITLFLFACGGGGESEGEAEQKAPAKIESAQSCDITAQNQFVYDTMQDSYLWYDEVPALEPSQFESPQALLEHIKEQIPLDRFSSVTTIDENTKYMEAGTYEGFGFSSELSTDNTASIIKYVYDDSPAARAGLKRSDNIIAIDGISVESLVADGKFEDALGSGVSGSSVSLTVKSIALNARDITLTKDIVAINSVLLHKTIEYDNKKYGYFAFTRFIEPSKAELDRVFSDFASENVDEVIMDLRDNTGGYVYTAQYLASLIGGQHTAEQHMFSYVHNDKYGSRNSQVNFENNGDLGYNKLTVLTSNTTCSASELTINSLAPYIDVKLIGGRTCGKPFGYYNRDFCEIRLLPIEFKVQNSLFSSDYVQGFEPDCVVIDDVTLPLGDPNESLLKAALKYSSTGVCEVTDAQAINHIKRANFVR